MDDPGIWYDRDRFASTDEALAFARRVLGIDDLLPILDRLGISWRDYLGLPPPPAATPPRLRVIRGGRR